MANYDLIDRREWGARKRAAVRAIALDPDFIDTQEHGPVASGLSYIATRARP
jgi:hypothetical protein